MNATQTIEEAVGLVAKHPADTELRIARRLEIGGVLHQGDVYLHRVADDHPRGKLLGTRQVAVGTTIGSRHVMEGSGVEVFEGKKLPPSVKVMAWCREQDLLGPVVVVTQEATLTHPEHAHHRPPTASGTYQVTYQADFATRRRVMD